MVKKLITVELSSGLEARPAANYSAVYYPAEVLNSCDSGNKRRRSV